MRPAQLALSAITLSAVAFAMSTASSQDDNVCSMDRMEVAPRAVIEPCSTLLQHPDLSAEQRGLALFVRGRGYHRSGRIDLAQQDYDEAIKLIPANDELYVSRANISWRLNRYPEGHQFLAQALAINPKNAHALRMLGLNRASNGQIDDAIDYLSRALEADPTEAYALKFRSEFYLSRRQFDLAFKDADALVAMPPEVINRQGYLARSGRMLDFHVVALQTRASLSEKVGRYELAEQDHNAAVAYQRSVLSLTGRAEFLQRRPAREKEALENFDAALIIEPDNSHVLFDKAVLLTRLNRTPEALPLLDHAVAAAPENGRLFLMRAFVHRDLDQPDAATSDYVTAIALAPDIVPETVRRLRQSGYWRSAEMPEEFTNEFRDALQACMLDKRC